ncbi:MAG: DUF4252 domain-containing protein [Lewinellaceae bacterium]|nr:DUF4252 domain-containing protein [Phaeodactylibacter sp.]MCB9042121.1 DUF4252 domain-containing protein [Lewinellaceae bacterium]
MRISIVLLALFSLFSCSSPKTTAQFYHTHKHKEGVSNFKMPGWLVWIGGGIAQGLVQDPEARAGLRLARKVKKLRFMATEDYNPITTAEVSDFVNNIRSAGYEDLLQVKEGGSTVHILSREKKEKLKNLVILVNDEEEFVFMDMKSRLKYEDLSELVNTILKAENMKTEEEQKQEEQPAESGEQPVVAKKEPRA